MDSASDAAHTGVSTDKGIPHEAEHPDLSSGKQRKRKSRSGKGPNVGTALVQNIDQANQILENSMNPNGEVGGRIQGNCMDVESTAGLNAERSSNIFSSTHPLEKSQKTVQSSRGMVTNKADPIDGSVGVNHRSVTTSSQQDSRYFTRKGSYVPHGVEGPSGIMSQGVTHGANLGFYPRPLSPAVSRRRRQYLNGMISPSELLYREQLMHWNVPYGANSYFAPRPVAPNVWSPYGVNSYFAPRPLAPNVWRRSQRPVNGMAGPSQVMSRDVPYGENSCFVPPPFVPSVSRRSEHHVNGVEGPLQMTYWDASYGANLCLIPRHVAPVVNTRKKLLVLDINGLLADIVMPSPKGCRADKHILGRAVFKRPFYYEFLVFCCERFDVGIWSSRSKKVIDKVVDYLLGDLQTKLVFCWNMLHCTETKFKTRENKHKPLVFKELRKLWEKDDPSLPWERGYYNESNTVLIDDSPYKALLNPINTAIFPQSFQYKDKKNKSLGPGGDLRVYLEGLAAADDVRKFIAQHPFGQDAIDKRNRFWSFYCDVLRSCSVQDAQVC